MQLFKKVVSPPYIDIHYQLFTINGNLQKI